MHGQSAGILKEQFLLDPDLIYLNHGAFGACPRPVFEAYQTWQRRLEHNPVEFLGREIQIRMAEARQALASYLDCQRDDIVFFPNPTTAISMVARSLDLEPGDEILATNHEYGAMDRTWRYICEHSGASYLRWDIPLPVISEEQIVDQFWSGVNDNTRIIFISHITSPTALRFPVEVVCERARQAGITSIVDGAHAPGQIPLSLRDTGADLYTGACHKWLCAPKGSAFLFARDEVQVMLDPLVISWGWEAENPGPSQFIDHHEWQGSFDPAAYLAVPAAIEFQRKHNWGQIQSECHRMAVDLRRELVGQLELEPLFPESENWLGQMFAVRLPEIDTEALQRDLREKYQIEVACWRWEEHTLMRVSVQGYNTESDGNALLAALKTLLLK
jgi:isopenicillin-N epimerase